MQRYILIFLFLVISGSAFTQRADSYLVVYFQSKQGTPFTLANPERFLSQRAIERRERFSIPIDSTDLPVNPALLDSLLQCNIAKRILYTSRWFNCAVVEPKSGFKKRVNKPWITSVAHGNARKTEKFEFSPFDEEPRKDNSGFPMTSGQLSEIGIAQLHSMGLTGQGVVVAVLDAGFRSLNRLPVLDSLRLQQRIVAVRDFVEFDGSVYENHSHGTSVMALMAGIYPGKYRGSAPGASYVLIRTEDAASETRLEEYNWLAGAEYADSLGVDVINSSLGYNKFDNPAENYSINDLTGNVAISSRAAGMAAAKGIMVVSSAGNDGNTSWRYLDFPADHPNVIAVGATDSTGQLWSGSSVGMPFHSYKPDFVARGVDIWVPSTYTTGFYRGNGTSFSSPIFAGGVACLMQHFPTKSPQQIRQALMETARNANQPNNLMGYGLPDFRAAFYKLKDMQPPSNEIFVIQKILFNKPNSTLEIEMISLKNDNVFIEVFDSLGRTLQSVEKEIIPEMPTSFEIPFSLPTLPQMVVVVFRGAQGNATSRKIILH
jgi:hypothetical protein